MVDRKVTYKSVPLQVGVGCGGILVRATPVQMPDDWPSAPAVGLQMADGMRRLLVPET
jgi:hypothetical protein